MPGEHGIGLVWLLREQLVVVDDHPITTELGGDVGSSTLVDVALPLGEVRARQHHVDDRVVLRIAAVVAGHVAEVLAHHVDLATQEPVVHLFDAGDLVVREDTGEMDEAVLGEAPPIVVVDDVPAVDVELSHDDLRIRGEEPTVSHRDRRRRDGCGHGRVRSLAR